MSHRFYRFFMKLFPDLRPEGFSVRQRLAIHSVFWYLTQKFCTTGPFLALGYADNFILWEAATFAYVTSVLPHWTMEWYFIIQGCTTRWQHETTHLVLIGLRNVNPFPILCVRDFLHAKERSWSCRPVRKYIILLSLYINRIMFSH